MFTGIVEEKGSVVALSQEKNLAVLSLTADKVLEGVVLGASIAVDGVCLTVNNIDGRQLSFDVMKETLRATTIGDLGIGAFVNLERAVRIDGRLDGHIVTGHVDGVENLKQRVSGENYIELCFSLDSALAKYIVPKGSVTVNGVSLTVGQVTEESFSVYLIPVTAEVTNLGQLKEGDAVNIEVDVLARYIEKQVHSQS